MVGGVDDNRIVQETIALQEGEKISYHLIEKVDAGKIGSAGVHHLLLSYLFAAKALYCPYSHRVISAVTASFNAGRRCASCCVAIYKTLRGCKGKMRSTKGCVEKPRLLGCPVTLFAQPSERLARDYLFL